MNTVHLEKDTAFNTDTILKIHRIWASDGVYCYYVFLKDGMQMTCKERDTPWSGWSWLNEQFGAE